MPGKLPPIGRIGRPGAGIRGHRRGNDVMVLPRCPYTGSRTRIFLQEILRVQLPGVMQGEDGPLGIAVPFGAVQLGTIFSL